MLIAMPVFFVFLLATSILRGVGDTVTPLWTLLVSTVVGLIVTPALIAGWFGLPKLGVASAAVASLVSLVVAMAWLAWYLLRRKHPLAPNAALLRCVRLDWNVLDTVLRIGVPTGVQMVIMALAELVLLGLANSYGSNATAAYGAINQVLAYVQFPAMSIGIAASILGAQAIGARPHVPALGDHPHRPDAQLHHHRRRRRRPSTCSRTRSWRCSSPTRRSSISRNTCCTSCCGAPVVFGMAVVFSGMMRSSGTVLAPTAIGIFSILAVEVPVAWFLSGAIGIDGVWIGYPAAFTAMFILQGVVLHIRLAQTVDPGAGLSRHSAHDTSPRPARVRYARGNRHNPQKNSVVSPRSQASRDCTLNQHGFDCTRAGAGVLLSGTRLIQRVLIGVGAVWPLIAFAGGLGYSAAGHARRPPVPAIRGHPSPAADLHDRHRRLPRFRRRVHHLVAARSPALRHRFYRRKIRRAFEVRRVALILLWSAHPDRPPPAGSTAEEARSVVRVTTWAILAAACRCRPAHRASRSRRSAFFSFAMPEPGEGIQNIARNGIILALAAPFLIVGFGRQLSFSRALLVEILVFAVVVAVLGDRRGDRPDPVGRRGPRCGCRRADIPDASGSSLLGVGIALYVLTAPFTFGFLSSGADATTCPIRSTWRLAIWKRVDRRDPAGSHHRSRPRRVPHDGRH